MGNVRGFFLVFILCCALSVSIGWLWLSDKGQEVLAADQRWSLIIGGDVMLGRSVNTRSLKYHDFNFPFLKIGDFLSSADLSMVNLETPVVSGCKPTDAGMIFCAPPESLDGLLWAGVDVVNLDNNHSHNYGAEGYDETKTHLEKKGIGFFDDDTYWEKKIKGISVGVLGFDLVSDHSKERIGKMLEIVSEKSQKVDVMIVNLHWGAEYIQNPDIEMRRIAKELVASGARLIVGHHSHVIGRFENINGVPVFYSLGNLVFDQMWSESTRLGLLVKLEFDGNKIKGWEHFPVKIYDYGQPRLVEGSERGEIIDEFLDYSQQGSL